MELGCNRRRRSALSLAGGRRLALCCWLLLGSPLAWSAAAERAEQAEQALALAAQQAQIAEAAMFGLLLQVQQAQPDLADADWLQQLAGYSPQIMRPHDHAAHVQQAVYPVDVMAKGQLNRLQREMRRQAGQHLLDQPERFVAAYRAELDWANGYLDALGDVDPVKADRLHATLAPLPLDQRLADLLGELALLRVDAAALERALTRADPVRAGRWLGDLRQAKSVLYPTALRAARARPELAAWVAALQLEDSKGSSADDRASLLTQLADPHLGAAAILPLAGALDRSGVDAIRQALAAATDPLLRRRLLLVLDSAPAARPVLAELRQDHAFLHQLDQETRAWLLR